MEVMYFVVGVLVVLNVVQMWMNVRLTQGKDAGLPSLASQLLIVVQQNQQQLIEALKERAAKTPDPRDDAVAALFEKYLPTLLGTLGQIVPASDAPNEGIG